MLDITDSELDFCVEWVRTRDRVRAVRALGTFQLGKDPDVLWEREVERPVIAYVIKLMERVWLGGDSEVDIDDERGNKRRIVGDLRKVGRSAAQDREHEHAIKALEMEGKVLGVITEKRDISLTAQMKDPAKLTMSEMRRLLEAEMVDVTPNRETPVAGA